MVRVTLVPWTSKTNSGALDIEATSHEVADDDDSKGKKGRESDANSGILLDPALLVNPFDDQAGNDAGNTRSNHHRHAMRKPLWNRRWGSFGGDWQLPCTGDEEGNGHTG